MSIVKINNGNLIVAYNDKWGLRECVAQLVSLRNLFIFTRRVVSPTLKHKPIRLGTLISEYPVIINVMISGPYAYYSFGGVLTENDRNLTIKTESRINVFTLQTTYEHFYKKIKMISKS